MLKLEDGVALDDVDGDTAILGVAEGLGLAPVVGAQRNQRVGLVKAVHDRARETGLAQRLPQALARHAEGEDAALTAGGGAYGGNRRRRATPLQGALAS